MIGFNGTGLMLQPSSAHWNFSDALGFNGNGQGVYPGVQEFELVFNLESQQEWYELTNYFNMVSLTGSLTATLPDPYSPVFAYRNFSGCILRKPTMTEYFAEEYSSEVHITIAVRL